MTIQSILLPVFVLVFAVFFLLGWMISERRVNRSGSNDARATQTSAVLQNQFEMPPLFFVLVILAIITRKADYLFVITEWLYVIFRIGHAFVFATTNNKTQRGTLFMLSAVVLFIMWVVFAVRILFSPTFGAL